MISDLDKCSRCYHYRKDHIKPLGQPYGKCKICPNYCTGFWPGG